MKQILDNLEYAECLFRDVNNYPTHLEHTLAHKHLGFAYTETVSVDYLRLSNTNLPDYRRRVFEHLTYTFINYLYGDIMCDYLRLISESIRRSHFDPNSDLNINNTIFLNKWLLSSHKRPDTFKFTVLDNRSPEEYDML